MAKGKISGGYYIKARAIQHSTIMKTPPCTRELWDFFLLHACFSPKKYNGKTLERGQLFISIDEIRKALSWQIGARRESYTRDQMKTSLKTLRSHLMITTTKTPSGIIITICNYDYYQNPKNYETTNETTNDNPTKPPRSHQATAITPANISDSEPLKKEKKERIINIVEYLNKKTGKSFRPNIDKTKTLIESKLDDKFTVEDFKTVIDIKSSQWLNTDQEKYLRPETLFGNKFEGYLNEKPKKNGQERVLQNLTHAENLR